MAWHGASPNSFPLSTVSFFGDWIPILNEDEEPTGDLQYKAEIDYPWLIKPPALYDDAWDKWYAYKGGARKTWVWGNKQDKASTLLALSDGLPSGIIKSCYTEAQLQLEPIILPSAPTMKRRRIYNQDDGDPDIEIALSGNENYLVKRKRTVTEKRIIHLAWQLVHSHIENEMAMARQTAAAVAVTDHLEKNGYRVKLTGYIGIKVDNMFRKVEASRIPLEKRYAMKELLLQIPIKHENMPLDEMKVLTFGLPGVIRHYGFAWISSVMGTDTSALSSGLGRVLYDRDFSNAVARTEKITATVSSDAPDTMKTIIREL